MFYRLTRLALIVLRIQKHVLCLMAADLIAAIRRTYSAQKGDTPMKSKEELNALKEEVETLNKKLAELSEEELEQVTGGKASPKKSGSAITT